MKCTVCDDEVERKLTYVYDSKKYKIYAENTPSKMNCITNETKRYTCMKCHSQIQPQFQCVSYNLYINMHLCKHYSMNDYDFKQYVVSRCLQHITDEQDEPKYICLLCDKTTKKLTMKTQLYHIT